MHSTHKYQTQTKQNVLIQLAQLDVNVIVFLILILSVYTSKKLVIVGDRQRAINIINADVCFLPTYHYYVSRIVAR